MPAFKHFDPDAFLQNQGQTPAKVAKVAKLSGDGRTLATLATLAASDGEKCTDEEVAEWLRQNPPPAGQRDICSHCSNVISDTDPMVVDATTGADHPPEFHDAQCHAEWLGARRRLARQELSKSLE